MATDPPDRPLIKVYGAEVDDRLGGNQEGAAFGDVNGNGYMDLAVGLYRARPEGLATHEAPGAGVILHGGPGSASGEIDLSQPVGTFGETRIIGEFFAGQLGSTVITGDFNGNGYADVAFSAPIASPLGRSAAGEIVIVYGGPEKPGEPMGDGTLIDLSTSGGAPIHGITRIFGREEWHVGFGMQFADLNGDGYDDLIIGAPFAPSQGEDQGAVIVIPGGPEKPGTPTGDGTVVDLMESEGTFGEVRFALAGTDKFGYSVAVGDLNGSGFPDIIIGAPDTKTPAGPNTGAVFALPGGRDFFDPNRQEQWLRIYGERGRSPGTGDRFGQVVSAANVNNDRYADILIAAPHGDAAPFGGPQPAETNEGKAYIILGGNNAFGSTLNLSTASELPPYITIFTGPEPGAFAGWSIYGGDFDGDGIDDIAVSVGVSDPQGRAGAGEAWMYSGWQDGDATDLSGQQLVIGTHTPGLRIMGEAPDDNAGRTTIFGDFNGSGIADFYLTAVFGNNPHLDPPVNTAGSGYLIFGQAATNTGTRQAALAPLGSGGDSPAWVDFGPVLRLSAATTVAGDSPAVLTATIQRQQTPTGDGLPGSVLPVSWSVNSTHPTRPTAVELRFTEEELGALEAEHLTLFYWPAGSDRYEQAADVTVDPQRRRISGILQSTVADLAIGTGIEFESVEVVPRVPIPNAQPGFTNTRDVRILLGAAQRGTPTHIEIAENPGFVDAVTVAYEGQDSLDYTLADGAGGERTVYVRPLQEGAPGIASDASIVLDRQAPTVTIESGDVQNGATVSHPSAFNFVIGFDDMTEITGFDPAEPSDLLVEEATLTLLERVENDFHIRITPADEFAEVRLEVPASVAFDSAGNPNTASAPFSFTFDGRGPSPIPGGELRFVFGNTAIDSVDAFFEVEFNKPIWSVDMGMLREGLHVGATTLAESTVSFGNLQRSITLIGDDFSGPYRIRIFGTVPEPGELVLRFRPNTIFDAPQDGRALNPEGIEGRVSLVTAPAAEGNAWIVE